MNIPLDPGNQVRPYPTNPTPTFTSQAIIRSLKNSDIFENYHFLAVSCKYFLLTIHERENISGWSGEKQGGHITGRVSPASSRPQESRGYAVALSSRVPRDDNGAPGGD